jgi:hypothetical protein
MNAGFKAEISRSQGDREPDQLQVKTADQSCENVGIP